MYRYILEIPLNLEEVIIIYVPLLYMARVRLNDHPTAQRITPNASVASGPTSLSRVLQA